MAYRLTRSWGSLLSDLDRGWGGVYLAPCLSASVNRSRVCELSVRLAVRLAMLSERAAGLTLVPDTRGPSPARLINKWKATSQTKRILISKPYEQCLVLRLEWAHDARVRKNCVNCGIWDITDIGTHCSWLATTTGCVLLRLVDHAKLECAYHWDQAYWLEHPLWPSLWDPWLMWTLSHKGQTMAVDAQTCTRQAYLANMSGSYRLGYASSPDHTLWSKRPKGSEDTHYIYNLAVTASWQSKTEK